MTRTVQDNATEFGRITKQGQDVHLALLVACSVEKGTAGRPRNHRVRDDSQKVSAQEFARAAGSTADRVLRHLAAWDRMVENGWSNVDRDMLIPADVDTIEITDKFVTEFNIGGLDSKGAGKLGLSQKAADIRSNKAAMQQAIIADPDVAAAALKAISQSDHRGVEGVSSINRPPQSAEGKAFAAMVDESNSASTKIAKPVFEACILLQGAEREWANEIQGVDPVEQRQIERTLTDIIVLGETLKMNLALDQNAGVTK